MMRDTTQKYTYGSFLENYDPFQDPDTLLGIARMALSTCLRDHDLMCSPYPLESADFLPTRLLDLENFECPKLAITSQSEILDRRYVPLSHEWGKPNEAEKKAMITTSENLPSRMAGFDLWSLPRRFVEVVFVCHAMGVRYLWIDCLCIIQVSFTLSKFT